jgi:hypothetical protein
MASPLNPMVAPVVTYEYPFNLPSSERPRPPARLKTWGLLSGSCTPRTVSHQLHPNEYGYDIVPSSGNRVRNHVPYTRYGPTTPG